MIEEARLVFKNFTVVTDLAGAINIQLSALNPGQNWNENSVTSSTVPSVEGVLGTVDFSQAEPSLDITNFFVKAISGQFQQGLFGFQVGLPGGPVEVPSHRADADSIVIEVMYSPLVGPGGTAPTTGAPVPPSTTTTAPTEATTTRPVCWTCGAGYVHYYDVEGGVSNGDPCACVRANEVVTTTRAPTTTTTASPSAPATSAAPGTPSTTSGPTTTAAPNQPERNAAKKVTASLAVIAAAIALLL